MRAFLLSFLYPPPLSHSMKLFIYPIQEKTAQSISLTLIGSLYRMKTDIVYRPLLKKRELLLSFSQNSLMWVISFVTAVTARQRTSTGLKTKNREKAFL